MWIRNLIRRDIHNPLERIETVGLVDTQKGRIQNTGLDLEIQNEVVTWQASKSMLRTENVVTCSLATSALQNATPKATLKAIEALQPVDKKGKCCQIILRDMKLVPKLGPSNSCWEVQWHFMIKVWNSDKDVSYLTSLTISLLQDINEFEVSSGRDWRLGSWCERTKTTLNRRWRQWRTTYASTGKWAWISVP